MRSSNNRRKGKVKSVLPVKKFGGPQPGSGRKPHAIEMKAKEFILSCINGEEGVRKLILKIYKQAAAGSSRHQEMLLNYILGKPVDRLILEANSDIPVSNQTIIKVVAENVRLDRLEKDIQERQHELGRVKDAEVVIEQAIMGAIPGEGSVGQALDTKLKQA